MLFFASKAVFFLFLREYSFIAVEINEFLSLQLYSIHTRVLLHSNLLPFLMTLPQYNSLFLQ